MTKVLERLKIGRDVNETKPNPQNPKSGNPDQKIETFSLNNVQQNSGQSSKKGFNNKGNHKTFTKFIEKKCAFCSEVHPSSKCPNVVSKDERIKILQRDRKDNCNTCWSKH